MRRQCLRFFLQTLAACAWSLHHQVELDKEAGIPEVQRIATAVYLDANEIQVVTTSALDVNEVQVIRTSASPRGEVQTVTVSPPPGENSIDSSYAFALELNTIGFGGSIQYSGQISANASPDGSRSSMAEVLGSMSNVKAHPSVSRSGLNPDGGHTYSITFPSSMGNVPQIEVFLSDVPVVLSTVEDGNTLGGSFRLEFGERATVDVPHDATAVEVRGALEDLPSVGTVRVNLAGEPDNQGGRTWEVEFTSNANGGDIPNIVTHGDGLTTTNPMGEAKLEIIPGEGRDGSYILGTFVIDFSEFFTPISSLAVVGLPFVCLPGGSCWETRNDQRSGFFATPHAISPFLSILSL